MKSRSYILQKHFWNKFASFFANLFAVLIAIDGAWGQWTDWSTCTAACNGGMRKRSRFCDAPFPAHGGSDCVGAGYVEEQCNTDACPSMLSNPIPILTHTFYILSDFQCNLLPLQNLLIR